MLVQIPTNNPEVDLAATYDAVVVGSGAAGGMAALSSALSLATVSALAA